MKSRFALGAYVLFSLVFPLVSNSVLAETASSSWNSKGQYSRPFYYERERGQTYGRREWKPQGYGRAIPEPEITTAEQRIIDSSNCEWVKEVDGGEYKKAETIVGYPVEGCSVGRQTPTIVCSGTARCHVKLGKAEFSMLVENTLCAVEDNRHGCPSANTCIAKGGALADMDIVDFIGKPQEFKKEIPHEKVNE